MTEILSREEFDYPDTTRHGGATDDDYRATIEALADELRWSMCPLTNEEYENLAEGHVIRENALRDKGWI